MTRYLVLYAFHEINRLSMHRLLRLQRMNPHVTIVPFFGVSIRTFLPRTLEWVSLRSSHIFQLLETINNKIESIRRHSGINALDNALYETGLKLYPDFTPLGYYNLDLAILNWFSKEGKTFDFEFLVFFEWDMFATKTIDNLYGKYTIYDASFMGYGKRVTSWYWYNQPLGALKSISCWLKDRGLDTTLYGCLFGGNMISRKVLIKLEKMQLPYCHCEMRFPTIITNLGFSCGQLEFPMAERYKRPISRSFIEKNSNYGLFHPVYDDFDY